MSMFDDADEKPAGAAPLAGTERRLPRGVSLLVIGALSALSWAIVVCMGLALRSIL